MLPSPSDFVAERAGQRIGIKSALMEYAALERELRVTRHSRSVIVAEGESMMLAFNQMNGSRSSQVGRFFCDRKEQSRSLLASAGLSVTPSGLFRQRERAAAWEYASSLNSEVVVKPTNSARGKGITTGVSTKEQFDTAWKKAFGVYRNPSQSRVLVEKQVEGEDFRFFVIGERVVSCTQRRRANVRGDGQSTIAELIEQKNTVRAQNPYLGSYLIPTDEVELDRLALHGWKLQHVPSDGEVIELRGASNLSAGGDSIDYTDTMHAEFRDSVIRALEAIPAMAYAGVDIIAPSITVKPDAENYVIGEVEYSPAPITHFPAEGAARDMAGAILDFYIDLHRRA